MAENSTDDVEVSLGARIDSLIEGLSEAGAKVKEFASESAEQVEALNGKISSIGNAFKELAELATLGVIGEQFVELGLKTSEYAEGLELASQRTGATTEKLAELGYAATTVGASSETMQRALQLLSRNMQSVTDDGGPLNQAFKAIGLSAQQVKEMSPEEVLERMAVVFSSTQDGASKTALAMQLLGRNGAELIPLLNKGAAGLDELGERAKQLGLVLSGEASEAALAMAEKMKEVHGAAQGLEMTIGQQLQPTLMAMATAFVDVATDGQTFKTAGEAIGAVMQSVAFVAGAVFMTLKDMGDGLGALAAQAVALAHGDLAGATAIGKMRDEEEAKNEAAFEKMKSDLAGFKSQAEGVHIDVGKGGGEGGWDKKGKVNFDPNANKGADAMAAARLALQKANEEAILALQKQYATEGTAVLDDAYKNNLVTTEQYYASRLQMQLNAADVEIDGKKKELAALQAMKPSAKPEENVKRQAEEAKLEGEIAVMVEKRTDAIRANGTAYMDAARQRSAALAEIAASEQKTTTGNQIATEKANLEALKSMRMVSADDALAIERDLENRSFAADQAYYAQKLQLANNDAQKIAEIKAQELNAEQQHAQRLLAIDQQAAQQAAQFTIDAQAGIEKSFQTMFAQIIGGATKLKDVFHNFTSAVGTMFEQLIAQRFADRLFGSGSEGNGIIKQLVDPVQQGLQQVLALFVKSEAQKLAASKAADIQQKGLDEIRKSEAAMADNAEVASATAATSTITEQATAGAQEQMAAQESASVTITATRQTEAAAGVMSYASAAATAAMASVAAIPIYGWALAAGVGAAVFAGAKSYLASAAGGWDEVPEDQLAMVHKDEMIMSAPLAEGIRKMVASGGQQSDRAGQQWQMPTSAMQSIARTGASATPSTQTVAAAQSAVGGRSTNVTFNVSAIDGPGVKQFFMTNGRAIATALQTQGRNFVPVNPG